MFYKETLKHLSASQLTISSGDGKVSPGQHTAIRDCYSGQNTVVLK